MTAICIVDLQAFAMDPDAPEISVTDVQAETAPGYSLNSPPCPEPDEAELCLYRKRTVHILKRYFNLSMETGRLPSVLGNLHFRARVSAYPTHTFEDNVIFVLDVERCLHELDTFSQELIGCVILQEYTPEDVARRLQCSVRSIERRVPEALDELSKEFLCRGILRRSTSGSESCQEAKNSNFGASDSKESKNKFGRVGGNPRQI